MVSSVNRLSSGTAVKAPLQQPLQTLQKTFKVAKEALVHFVQLLGRVIANLCKRFVSIIREAAAWLKSILLMILGWFRVKRIPEKQGLSLSPGIVSQTCPPLGSKKDEKGKEEIVPLVSPPTKVAQKYASEVVPHMPLNEAPRAHSAPEDTPAAKIRFEAIVHPPVQLNGKAAQNPAAESVCHMPLNEALRAHSAPEDTIAAKIRFEAIVHAPAQLKGKAPQNSAAESVCHMPQDVAGRAIAAGDTPAAKIRFEAIVHPPAQLKGKVAQNPAAESVRHLPQDVAGRAIAVGDTPAPKIRFEAIVHAPLQPNGKPPQNSAAESVLHLPLHETRHTHLAAGDAPTLPFETLQSLSDSLRESFHLPKEEVWPLVPNSADIRYHESGCNLLLKFVASANWDEKEIKDLKCAILYCVELTESEIALSEQQKRQICHFFEQLKLKAGNRIDYQLYLGGREKLQRIISPRLDELLKIENPNMDQKLEIRLARGELAVRFGYGIVPTKGGNNGAVFITTLEGKRVGVFKAPQKLSLLDWIERAKQYFGQARLLSSDKGAREEAEVIASELSKSLKFDMAPDAKIAEFCGQKGAFIAFLDGYSEFGDVAADFDKRESFTHEELCMWQLMAIWNFFVGNLDPHKDNIFVKTTKNQAGALALEGVQMIDHGNCFPVENPSWLPDGNLGAWGKFKISQFEFTKEIMNFCESIECSGFMDKRNFFTPAMKRLQKQRARILREHVATGKIKSPAELSKIKKDADFAKYQSDVSLNKSSNSSKNS